MKFLELPQQSVPGAAGKRKHSVDPNAVTLRPVTKSDEPFLLALYASTRRDEVNAWGWPEPQIQAFLAMQFRAQRQSYDAAYPGAEHHVICLGADGQPAGRLLVFCDAGQLCLVDISLLPEARNRGIGTRVIQQLFERCRARHWSMNLQVAVTNQRALSLYERLGFRHSGGDAMYVQMTWNP